MTDQKTEPKKFTAKAAPKRTNPVEGSPEIYDKFPGDEGYDYESATRILNDGVNRAKAKMAEAQELRTAVLSRRPATLRRTDAERWQAQRDLQNSASAVDLERKAKIALVLKQMDLM